MLESRRVCQWHPMSSDTHCKGDSRNKCTLCVPGSLYLFIWCKKEGMVLKTCSLEICISVRKTKMYHIHFKALQVPILAEVISNYDTETRSWCERQWCKNPLIRIILIELFCIYTSFTKMEADSGSLHKSIHFVPSSPFICHNKPPPLLIIFYLWNVFIFSESIC